MVRGSSNRLTASEVGTESRRMLFPSNVFFSLPFPRLLKLLFFALFISTSITLSNGSNTRDNRNHGPTSTFFDSNTPQPADTRGRKPFAVLRDSKPTCSQNEFQCMNGMCILSKWICDSFDDCGDYSDEFNCTRKMCPSDRFNCGQGQCISKEFLCDKENDCLNGKDEADCDKKECDESREIKCSDGMCFPLSSRCDGEKDCADGADEKGCPSAAPEVKVKCRDTQFKCKNNDNCIEKTMVCNKEKDCADGSDEIGCNYCAVNQFSCKSENMTSVKCIPKMYTCDSIKDCEDGSDEDLPECPKDGNRSQSDATPMCGFYQFRCQNGQCIDNRKRCDRNFDCFDGSDEESCGPAVNTFPPATQSAPGIELRVYDTPQTIMAGYDVVFRCREEGDFRYNVSWSRKDGKPFPPKTTDIKGRLTMYSVTMDESGIYICSVSGLPGIYKEATLSVYLDPSRGGARPGPEPVRRPAYSDVCGPNQIKCRSGDCIPRSKVCDSVMDCSDKSDESSCSPKCNYDQFKCESSQCVRKSNRCDGEIDCYDASDERNCESSQDTARCHFNQFQCVSGSQCIPTAYQCDGYFDCKDASDELRCHSPRFMRVPPNTVEVEEGSALRLNCTVSGEPSPIIKWRFNMDYISQSSKVLFCSDCGSHCGPNTGFGAITILDMRAGDQGLYTCEAENSMKRILAPSDTLVIIKSRRV